MPESTPKVLRIAMNGVTGRMGYRQHLLRSILPIRDAGGIELPDGTRVAVEPVLVGRNQRKIVELAELHKVEHWATDLDAVQKLEGELLAEAFATPEHKEAVAAFLEKRTPEYSNR